MSATILNTAIQTQSAESEKVDTCGLECILALVMFIGLGSVAFVCFVQILHRRQARQEAAEDLVRPVPFMYQMQLRAARWPAGVKRLCHFAEAIPRPVLPSHEECGYCLGRDRAGECALWQVPLVRDAPHPLECHQRPEGYPLHTEERCEKGEQEWILYHGTSLETTECILDNGFDPTHSADPSFGRGCYFTPCLRLARCFAPEGVILVCNVTPGPINWLGQYSDAALEGEDKRTRVLNDKTEVVVFEPARIRCVALVGVEVEV